MLKRLLIGHTHLDDAQFGFRAGLSIKGAIVSFKHTVKYYTERKTSVYACFLDLSKAFDRVIYDILWSKLEGTSIPTECVYIFKYWLRKQVNNVRWGDTMSAGYRLGCGVRITFPRLFNLYDNEPVERLSSMHIGCRIDNISVNSISYADDMVLLRPAIEGLLKTFGHV